MAALNADPAFSEISDAELNKSKTFGYIRVESMFSWIKWRLFETLKPSSHAK